MKKKTLTTTAALALLAWLIPLTTASAQEDTTIAEALEELQRKVEPGAPSWDHPYLPAVAILRQTSGPRPGSELDALADRLAAMAADATLPEHVRTNAKIVLADAAATGPRSPRGGRPYARAFDLLLRLYEGGVDDVLRTIFWIDPERGPAYVRGVFERSERPPICPGHRYTAADPLPPPECVRGYGTFHKATWCEAGWILYEETVGEAVRRMPRDRRITSAGQPRPVPDGLPEHVEDWYRRCQ